MCRYVKNWGFPSSDPDESAQAFFRGYCIRGPVYLTTWSAPGCCILGSFRYLYREDGVGCRYSGQLEKCQAKRANSPER